LKPRPEVRTNDRQYPERPLVGVGALIFKRKRVLLVERGKAPLKGYWSLPGGLVEAGERLDVAIRREVQEETGLVVRVVEFAELFERIMRDSEGRVEYHYVLADYVCKVIAGEPKAADDANRVDWFRIDRLADLLLTEGTREVIERAFAGKS
jgi:8-oxo-dGTP diphosphatase